MYKLQSIAIMAGLVGLLALLALLALFAFVLLGWLGILLIAGASMLLNGFTLGRAAGLILRMY